LTEEILQEIADKYKVNLAFVKSKLDDMDNWRKAKGKVYKDYKAALSNWVKSDALKVEQQKRQENRYKVETIKL
jgi:division protein CdvB (Snf7/Vps24/ESCRT-III family)